MMPPLSEWHPLFAPTPARAGRPARLLILTASVGGGHVSAARALETALRQTDPTLYIQNVDVLQLTNPLFRLFYSDTYFFLYNTAPHILGWLYDHLDEPVKKPGRFGDRMRILSEQIQLLPLVDLLKRGNWDFVVNTHFLSQEILASLRRQGKLSIPQATVITDFDAHRLWVHNPCEHYFVATAEGGAYLEHLGIPAERMTVSGIPVHPTFAQAKNREACMRAHDIPTGRPVVLQLAGGFGKGPLEEVYRSLLKLRTPVTLITITGRNPCAKAELEAIPVPDRHRVKIVGFTRQIDEFMAAADVVVSKPGGLTTSECLARGVPMAIVCPIPGQEMHNSDYLLENGAAVKINNIPVLPVKLDALLQDKPRLQEMRRQAARIARPEAAFTTARKLLSFLPGARQEFRPAEEISPLRAIA